MCEVEICDSSIVEVVDNEAFNDIGGVTYDHYEVGVADDDQYEEVTCENDDSQGLMLQNIEDGKNRTHQTHLIDADPSIELSPKSLFIL